MRIAVLASGSKGNALLVEAGETRLLVDAGVPVATLVQQMQRAGVHHPPTAALVTHAHGDHHRYIDDAAQRWSLPVYVTPPTRRSLPLAGARNVRVFAPGTAFTVGSLRVHPMEVPHDAPQVALRFTAGSVSAGLATDLGEVPPKLVEHFRGCDAVLIESNHDPAMLARGPYSPSLKRRIASSRGHLSNAQTQGLLRLLDPAVRTVVLMHLSETNNTPALARDSAAEALADHTATLLVASQTGVTVVETQGPAQLELFAQR